MLTDIDAAFEARITALIGEPVHWIGRAYHPDPNVGHLRVQVAGQDRRPLGVGAESPHEWSGLLYLVVVEPVAGGLRAANARATAVAAAFPRGATLVHGQAKVIILNTSIQAATVRADSIEAPVAINWSCWEP
jgi:hypothetical protein